MKRWREEHALAGLYGAGAKWISPIKVKDECLNNKIVPSSLPYGVEVEHVRRSLLDLSQFLDQLNGSLAPRVGMRLEELLPANAYSGILSHIAVRAIAAAGAVLVANEKVGGHPDLLPAAQYAANPFQQHADVGIEVKASRAKKSWQGHNAETCWLMIYQFVVDVATMPKENRNPLRWTKVMLGYVFKKEWAESGRREGSRRTPTASLNVPASMRLHAQWLYQDPALVAAAYLRPAIQVIEPADITPVVVPRRPLRVKKTASLAAQRTASDGE